MHRRCLNINVLVQVSRYKQSFPEGKKYNFLKGCYLTELQSWYLWKLKNYSGERIEEWQDN